MNVVLILTVFVQYN